MKRVTVLGSGPAGLFAALAALDYGAIVTVRTLSWQQPTANNAGVFVLESDINLPLRKREVRIIGTGGDGRDYSQKLYGDAEHPNSFPGWCIDGSPYADYETKYDGVQALGMAWDIVQGGVAIEEKPVTLADIEQIDADLVVSTVPYNLLANLPHLSYRCAWVRDGEAPADESYIMYNAHPHVPWYRASAVFGRFTLEYATEQPGLRMVRKVMRRSKPLPAIDRVLFTGRFGAWDKSKLSDSAYHDTMNALAVEHGKPVEYLE
jgi:hypothetical protein